jgi:hypothetical protein
VAAVAAIAGGEGVDAARAVVVAVPVGRAVRAGPTPPVGLDRRVAAAEREVGDARPAAVVVVGPPPPPPPPR